VIIAAHSVFKLASRRSTAPLLELQLDTLPQPAVRVSSQGRVCEVNDLACAMLGSSPETAREALTRELSELPSLTGWLANGSAASVFRARVQIRRANGVPVTLELVARRAEVGEAIGLLAEPDEERLAAEAQQYFDIAFETAPIGMALFNTDGEYIRVNAALCEMLGREAAELLGRRDQEFTHPEDRQADVDAAWRILNGELDTWQCEKRFLRSDGTEVWAIANLTFLRSPEGHPLSWVGQFQDISERKAQEAQLRELADRDPLTGVFNRRCLQKRLAAALRNGEEGAVIVVDLDGFKEINDTHGHRAGDLVLLAIASALREAVREEDIVARIGGDEFALVLRSIGEQEAAELAQVIDGVIAGQRFDFDPSSSVSASVGLTTFGPARPADVDEVMARADVAMYRAKKYRDERRLVPVGLSSSSTCS
jgi:diguanylate cyclase (GGDEF)-like protein/PAS domain S-box-containing protein